MRILYVFFLFVCWCMHMLCTVIASSCTKKTFFQHYIHTHTSHKYHPGLSAQELVSTFKAPATQSIINQKNSIESSGDINDPNSTNEDKEQRKVGKIGRLDISGEHTEIEESYEVSPRRKKEQVVVKDEVDKEEKKEVEEVKKVPSANEHDDEPKIVPKEESKVDTDIETTAPAVDNDDIINQVEKQREEPAVEEACPMPTTPLPISIEQPEERSKESPVVDEGEEEKPSNNNKRRKWTLLLLLLLIIIAIATVVGVMVSKGDENNTADDNNKAVEQDIVITEDETSTTTPTPEPYCPSSTTLFSIQSNIINGGSVQQQGGLQQEVGQQKTWILREACTNDIVMKCLPCSPNVASSSSLFSDTQTGQSNLFNNNNNEPVPSPSSSSTYSPTWLMDRNCIGNTNRPRPVSASGERFRFNLLLGNDDLTEAAGESGAIFSGGGVCVDNEGRGYEFGSFDNVGKSCFLACVLCYDLLVCTLL